MILRIILDLIDVSIIFLIIAFLWQMGEVLMYGHTTPRGIDNIICLILAVSMFFNMRAYL